MGESARRQLAERVYAGMSVAGIAKGTGVAERRHRRAPSAVLRAT